MNRFFIILILLILVSCTNKKRNTTINKVADTLILETQIIDNKNINNQLKKYFELHSIKPSIEINNTKGNQTVIQLGKHTIKWLNTEEETKIKIDKDLFTLKDKVTLNAVWNNNIDSIDFVNNWDKIKLFVHNEREYIGIRMSFAPCTGLGCNVSYFLMYDVTTKAKNFFGTYNFDDNLELFNFSNDNHVDYISKTYKEEGQSCTSMEFIYELYTIDMNGQFKEHKDNAGKIYQIKHTTFTDDTTKKEELTEHWISKIN